VQLPGAAGAIALAGARGIGKSTWAAMLVDDGAELIADDSVALHINERGIRAAGLPGGLFLRDEESGARQFRSLPPDRHRGVSQLTGIVVLTDDAETSEPRRLNPLPAVEQLLLHRHRPQVPDLLDMQGQVLGKAATIAQMIAVFALPRSHANAPLGRTIIRTMFPNI
jgi:hypothetical protein